MVKIIFPIALFTLLLFFETVRAEEPGVEVCTWKDGHKGALSISIDDSCLSCAVKLTANGLRGTYFMVTPPSRRMRLFNYPVLALLYRMGNEIGAHTRIHLDYPVSARSFQQDLADNLSDISKLTGVPRERIISMAWPAGYVQHKELAGSYFLSARGYNINRLEDKTPGDFMNLKSFNSHEHYPFPPKDFKDVLDQAEKEGKWAILVFHQNCKDNGAISYAREKDLWVVPIGRIIKYIVQRDNSQISNIIKTNDGISFELSWLEHENSRLSRFSGLLCPEDRITLEVDINAGFLIESVRVGGDLKNYKIRGRDDNKQLFIDVCIRPGENKQIKIKYRKRGSA